MKELRVIALLLNVLIFGSTALKSQQVATKYSNEFLTLGAGARSIGLGQSAVAYVDDVTSGYWNPAGLMSIKNPQQLSLMHAAYFAGIANYDYGAFAVALDTSSRLGISIIRFSVDNIPDTRFLFDANGRINYDNIRFFSASDYAFLLSYAKRFSFLGGIDFGGNIKIVHRIAGKFAKAWGFGLDFGLQKQVNSWKFGLFAKDVTGTFNAWSHNVKELREIYTVTGNKIPVNSLEITLPRVIVGVARNFHFTDWLSLLGTIDMDVTFDGKRNTIVRSNLVSVDPKAGLELSLCELAFIRFGINQIQEHTNLTSNKKWSYLPGGGIGFKIRELTIDYALTDIGDQSTALYSHIFSIKVDFNAKDK